MKYAMISQNAGKLPVSKACKALCVRREGYYEWQRGRNSPQSLRDALLTGKIRQVFLESDRIYGARRIHMALRKAGEITSRRRVRRLMDEAGLMSKTKRKFLATTDSRHNLPVSDNLLKQSFCVSQPNTVWVSDFTYVPTGEGWLYLCAVVDLYSRKVVGFAMDKTITRNLAIQALENAFIRRRPKDTLIVHTDRGSQYCSKDFQSFLWQHRALSSMSRKGNPYDNACAESFFKTIKIECIHHSSFKTRHDAIMVISRYIERFYNERRLHSHLGYLSPCEFELAC